MAIPVGKKFSYTDTETGEKSVCFVIHNDIENSILTMRKRGSRKWFKCSINELNEAYKPHYDSTMDTGILNVPQPAEEDGIYYLTDPDDLPEISVYKDKVDFQNDLQTVSVALLSMKQPEYILIDLKKHIKTNDFFVEIHKWQEYQKEFGEFVCRAVYYDQDDGPKIGFTAKLADYSSLRLCSYHVGGNLTESDRRRILMNCVFFNLVQKDEIIKHLETLIYNTTKEKAKEMWMRDLAFIKQ